MSIKVITDKGAYAISSILKDNQSLTSLFLRWNNIQSHGAASLCDALQKNNSLKVLELSFNPIGIGMNKDKHLEKKSLSKSEDLFQCEEIENFAAENQCNVCENFKSMFIQNKTLVHLDLTHCGFSFYECKIMNQGLKENHTLLGLHMTGNKMNVDALGFLRPYEFIPSISHIASRITEKLIPNVISDHKLSMNTCSNCWICEGWSQVVYSLDTYTFTNPLDSDLTEFDKVCIHLSFENFRPYIMTPQADGVYEAIRMVPPVPFNYYFTLNGIVQYTNLKLKTESTDDIIGVPFTYVYEEHTYEKNVINEEYFKSLKCVPRPIQPIIDEPEIKEPEWDIKESVFWGYIVDNDEILCKCFEFDWSKCKLPKIIKDPVQLEEIKLFLKANYKPIRETYKYHAGISPCGNIPCIGQNVFNELINKTEIVDGNAVKLSDIDFEFIATKAGIKNVALNPERWLVRYQFMEIFVRIALQKYYKPQKDINPKDRITQSMAVKKLFQNDLLPIFQAYDCNKWRAEKLWTQTNDMLIKENFKSIKRLYDLYSGKYSLPGKQKFMSLDEFNDLINSSNIMKNSNVGPGDVGASFNVSMMTQVNELENERHMQMTFVEFVEALFRILKQMSSKILTIEENTEEISSVNIIQGGDEQKKDQEAESKITLPEMMLNELFDHASV